jgi:hypothetical protein
MTECLNSDDEDEENDRQFFSCYGTIQYVSVENGKYQSLSRSIPHLFPELISFLLYMIKNCRLLSVYQGTRITMDGLSDE